MPAPWQCQMSVAVVSTDINACARSMNTWSAPAAATVRNVAVSLALWDPVPMAVRPERTACLSVLVR